MLDINLCSIYTTNIDDLWYKIFESSTKPIQLYNREKGADIDYSLKVNYYPLHGCVRTNEKYLFGVTEVASAFSLGSLKKSWQALAADASNKAILFWGWNFEDSGPIEAMYCENSKINSNYEKWVLLYKPDEETVDYLRSLNFNIIIGDTESLLEYISRHRVSEGRGVQEPSFEDPSGFFSRYTVPKNDCKLPSYSIDNYFLEYTPRWSHIYSNQIPRLRHYNKVADSIANGKDVIVIGIRCSGKTTLFMQLLLGYNTSLPKHYMIAPSFEDAKAYIAQLNNRKTLLFIDDCFRDTDAVCLLLSQRNIQVILFDRDFNYERQYHKIAHLSFQKIDITEISPEDAQDILSAIPQNLRNNSDPMKRFKNDPTIVTLLAGTIAKRNFRFFETFYRQDAEAASVFLMICYVHSCGVPCSFDMIYSFLGDEKYNWTQMYDVIERAGKLIKESGAFDFEFELKDYLQDYYSCRSRYLAEGIVLSIPYGDDKFKNVLTRFTENVQQYKICQYDRFRRSAYDAEIVCRAFSNVLEGESFYELCTLKDDSEYIFQQAAIYFARNKNYKLAFKWIDRAKSLSHYNRFSINSTYAQIFFDVNINASSEKMKEALNILKNCCESDKRKAIHFCAFATRAIVFCENADVSEDEKRECLQNALAFVNEGLSDKNAIGQKNKWELIGIRHKIQDLLQKYT